MLIWRSGRAKYTLKKRTRTGAQVSRTGIELFSNFFHRFLPFRKFSFPDDDTYTNEHSKSRILRIVENVFIQFSNIKNKRIVSVTYEKKLKNRPPKLKSFDWFFVVPQEKGSNLIIKRYKLTRIHSWRNIAVSRPIIVHLKMKEKEEGKQERRLSNEDEASV